MWEHPTEYCEGWNFGPREGDVATVWEMASELVARLVGGELRDVSDPGSLHEAGLLLLDIGKARRRLGWRPVLDSVRSVAWTAEWYRRYAGEDAYDLCCEQIENYCKEVTWKF